MALAAFFCCALALHDRQAGGHYVSDERLWIAIVGAGLSGASAAYHIREIFSPENCLSVTMFENSAKVADT
jgi:cation diffusion facilitator CzcD-associated flavoprotein CzcO